ncbi:hypothetical protein MMC25_001344 [Agyrium rufum]|nr:hypothetical protein [Agyrium rufum]
MASSFPPPPGSKSIAQILTDARSSLNRITPQQAYSELQASKPTQPTVLVDIRPAAQREDKGQLSGPNVLIIERNVLEWRFDPQSDARLPVVDEAGGYGLKVVIMCQEGYTSSLAAKALQDLGLKDATDLDGGFRRWREEGLPETGV